MARISQLINPVLLALALSLAACVGPDEAGMSSPAPANLVVSQGLSISPSFSIEGLELLSDDVRLKNLRFANVELVFTSLDGAHDDVSVPIDLMAFGADGTSSDLPDFLVSLPGEGRYSVRMQVRSGESADEDACIGLCFDALINPDMPSPFDSHLSDGDQGDGPNPHPFEGGDGGAPSKPGGDGDPVADGGDQGDGPNPHPFEGGDDGGDDGTPTDPNDGGDPMATEDSETSQWPTFLYESDDSMTLDMGEIEVAGEDSGSSVVLCIDLLAIKSSPGSVVIEPAARSAAEAPVHTSEHVRTEEHMHSHAFTPISAHQLHEDARRMNNRGRRYY